MSVCDGHGVEGHFVSDFIKEITDVEKDRNSLLINKLEEKI